MILNLKQFTCPSSAMDLTDQLLSHQTTNSPPASDIVSNKHLFLNCACQPQLPPLSGGSAFLHISFQCTLQGQEIKHSYIRPTRKHRTWTSKSCKTFIFTVSLHLEQSDDIKILQASSMWIILFYQISKCQIRFSSTVLDVFVAPHTQVKVKPFGCFFTSHLMNIYKANRWNV